MIFAAGAAGGSSRALAQLPTLTATSCPPLALSTDSRPHNRPTDGRPPSLTEMGCDIRCSISATDGAARRCHRPAEAVHEIGLPTRRPRGPRRLQRKRARVAAEFFALDDEDRQEIDNVRSPQFPTPASANTNGRVDLRVTTSAASCLPPVLVTGPPRLRCVTQPVADRPARPAAGDDRLDGGSRRPSPPPRDERAGQPADRFDATVDPRGAAQGHPPPHPRRRQRPSVSNARVGHRDTGFLSFVYQHESAACRCRRCRVRRAGATGFRGQHRRDVQLVRGLLRATVHRQPAGGRPPHRLLLQPQVRRRSRSSCRRSRRRGRAASVAANDPANYGDNS